jgi:hypothetical protein
MSALQLMKSSTLSVQKKLTPAALRRLHLALAPQQVPAHRVAAQRLQTRTAARLVVAAAETDLAAGRPQRALQLPVAHHACGPHFRHQSKLSRVIL